MDKISTVRAKFKLPRRRTNPDFKKRLPRQLLAIYCLLFFAIAFQHEFVFFVDSQTYLHHREAVVLLTFMLKFYPVWAAAHSVINLWLIYQFVVRSRSRLAYFILSPYVMLLLSNVTKEAYIFDGMLVLFWAETYFAGRPMRRYLTKGLALTLLTIRPIYFGLLVSGGKRYYFATVVALGALIAFPELLDHVTLALQKVSQGRAEVDHVGREFFDYLCVAQKSGLMSFAMCALPVFALVPIHRDTVSILYLPYVLFQLPATYLFSVMIVSRDLNRVGFGLMYLFLYLLIFLVSPTFGAFIRYFYPVVFYAGLYNYNKTLVAVHSAKPTLY